MVFGTVPRHQCARVGTRGGMGTEDKLVGDNGMHRAIMVASTGGQLAQLMQSNGILNLREDPLWSALAHPLSRSWPADAGSVVMPKAASREWRAAFGVLPIAFPVFGRAEGGISAGRRVSGCHRVAGSARGGARDAGCRGDGSRHTSGRCRKQRRRCAVGRQHSLSGTDLHLCALPCGEPRAHRRLPVADRRRTREAGTRSAGQSRHFADRYSRGHAARHGRHFSERAGHMRLS